MRSAAQQQESAFGTPAAWAYSVRNDYVVDVQNYRTLLGFMRTGARLTALRPDRNGGQDSRGSSDVTGSSTGGCEVPPLSRCARAMASKGARTFTSLSK